MDNTISVAMSPNVTGLEFQIYSKPRTHRITYYAIVLFATAVLLLTSRSSPIFWMNTWVDVNSYLTMGWSWLNGKIPFIDIYEQKGPLAYIPYAIAVLINSNNDFGLYIIEVISLSATIMLFYKACFRYLSESLSLCISFIFTIILVMNPNFSLGGSVEQMMYPFAFYPIYLITKLEHKGLKNKDFFIAGLCVAILFWSKFTLIGGWIGFIISFVSLAIYHKKTREVFRCALGGGDRCCKCPFTSLLPIKSGRKRVGAWLFLS